MNINNLSLCLFLSFYTYIEKGLLLSVSMCCTCFAMYCSRDKGMASSVWQAPSVLELQALDEHCRPTTSLRGWGSGIYSSAAFKMFVGDLPRRRACPFWIPSLQIWHLERNWRAFPQFRQREPSPLRRPYFNHTLSVWLYPHTQSSSSSEVDMEDPPPAQPWPYSPSCSRSRSRSPVPVPRRGPLVPVCPARESAAAAAADCLRG